MSKLELYVKNVCPYCVKVRRFMRENNIEITLKNFNKNPDYVHELCELGGLSQVPALSIDGKILYESEDIIAFLKDLKEKGAFNDS